MKSEIIRDNSVRRAGSGDTDSRVTRDAMPVAADAPDGESSEITRVTQATENPDGGRIVTEFEDERSTRFSPSRNRNYVIVGTVAIFALVALFGWFLLSRNKSNEQNVVVKPEIETADENTATAGSEVVLSPAAIESAELEYEGVTQRPAIALLRVTGTVESNQQQTQQATPLITGRVERVNVALGDRVGAGTVLAVISSPEIAEMHGKLHESVTRYELAQRNLTRVQRAENRVSVLQAKAKLDEADATLKRTRRLIELGAGAGKDLISAETTLKMAKADYDFQSNISLNRELQEARAAVETSRVDVSHIRDQLRALGAPVPEGARDDHSKDTSLVAVRAPVSGTVTERLVNAGAGIQAGTALFTIANISTVWVVANVPESQIGLVRPGTPAEVRSAALGSEAIRGQVSYIDPQLSEGTRTGRVRIVVANPGERLKVGMFAEVGFQTGTGAASGDELVVSASAIQRLGTKTIVFLAKQNETGVFEVREVETGGDVEGYTRILSGLKMGEAVVTEGSFILKTQLEKGAM